MKTCYLPDGHPARRRQPLVARLFLMVLLLAVGLGRAQGQGQAPPWELAVSSNNQPSGSSCEIIASAVDAAGNVYVTGSFAGSITFGSTVLTSVRSNTITDMFVAKWDATTENYTWATSGGGIGPDAGTGIAVNGAGVFVTGYFNGSTSLAPIAGQTLMSRGLDMFVAKYIDTSTGHTPVTSSFANGWATSGGGTGDDRGNSIAVNGTGVFVAGSFTSGSVTIAGQALTGSGNSDIFVAKYIDTSTGNTTATSSFANGWATSGGGAGDDRGNSIAINGTGVFVTGNFTSGNVTIAGQALTGAGNSDMFVAKYIDTSTGNTPATSSFANGWATSGGGTEFDVSLGIAVSGTGVFITGYFTTAANARFAGQSLTEHDYTDIFVAKYTDSSTGNTTATSSFTNGWAVGAGSNSPTEHDRGSTIRISGQRVYVTGLISDVVAFGTYTAGTANSAAGFLARLTDTALPLAATAATARPGLTLFPNPARDAVQVRGAAPGTALYVRDALGRLRATAPAAADGTTRVSLAGLPPGVYVVQSGGRAQRLVVE